MKTIYMMNMTIAIPTFNFHLKIAIVRMTNTSMTRVEGQKEDEQEESHVKQGIRRKVTQTDEERERKKDKFLRNRMTIEQAMPLELT